MFFAIWDIYLLKKEIQWFDYVKYSLEIFERRCFNVRGKIKVRVSWSYEAVSFLTVKKGQSFRENGNSKGRRSCCYLWSLWLWFIYLTFFLAGCASLKGDECCRETLPYGWCGPLFGNQVSLKASMIFVDVSSDYVCHSLILILFNSSKIGWYVLEPTRYVLVIRVDSTNLWCF